MSSETHVPVIGRDDPPRGGVPAQPPGGLDDSAKHARARLRDLAAVLAPTALVAALSLYDITARSLGFDEGASVTIAAQHGAALGRAIAHDGGNMSGYYVLLHAVLSAFGSGLLALRLASVLGAIATVALTGILALRVFDRRVAVVSGLLAAVSLPLVFWAQSARGYSLVVALVVASWLAFASLTREEGGGRRAWIAYVLCTSLAVYFSFVAVLIVPAQLVTLTWRRRAAPRVGLALLACAVCWAPLIVLAASRGTGQLFWVPRPTLTGENQVLEALTASGLQPNFRSTSTTAVLEAVTVLLMALAAAGIADRTARTREAAWGPALVLAWLVVPVAIAWLESLLGQPVFLPRNLLFVLPAVALLLGLGFADSRLPRALALALLGSVMALRALQLGASYGVSPEDWKGASGYVLARASGGDCVAFYPADARMAFDYYLGSRRDLPDLSPRPVLPPAPWSRVVPYVEDYATLSPSGLGRVSRDCSRLWLVSSHEGEADGLAASRINRARYLRLRARLAAVYVDLGTRSFGYASPIHVELFAARRLRAEASPTRTSGSSSPPAALR